MTDRELLDMWRFEEEFPFGGWDFSHLDGRWELEALPWDYDEIVRSVLRPTDRLLDIETGDGAYLLSLRHPYEKTAATERFKDDFELCENELAPLGIIVRRADASCEPLPFADASFDMAINRHGAYTAAEIARVLKPGGVYVTEQVGWRNNLQLSRRILTDYMPAQPQHDLAHEREAFEDEGLELTVAREYFPKLRFYDVGAIVYYASIMGLEFPGFSVDRYARELLCLERDVEDCGTVESLQHRFMIVAKKPL